jgi:membrane-associated phospholipid phosphatase
MKNFILLLVIASTVQFAKAQDSILVVHDSLKLHSSNKTFTKQFDVEKNELYIKYSQQEYVYTKPTYFSFVKKLPSDIFQTFKSPFVGKNYQGFLAVVAATGILVTVDKQAIKGVQKISTKIGLQAQTDYNIAFKVGDTKIVKVPQNLNSALYQMGEGGTSMLLAGGLWVYGKIKKDYRAIQTASDLTKTFFAMGFTTQVIKRITGRESPFTATTATGRWRPFPSFKKYQTETSNYDAFPSGHLATMMATVTVLRKNYPEKKWITPVGYTIMGLTSWAMMNTEVHWLSDYPLALAIGYISGKITTMKHQKVPKKLVQVL